MEIQFRDTVRVTNGFYQGCEGTVVSQEKIARDIYFYNVDICMLVDNQEWARETILVRENNLKIIKKASKVVA